MQVYYLELDNEKWDDSLNILLQFVSAKRQARIHRYRFDIDKKLSLYAELVLRYGIEQCFNITMPEIQFGYEKSGKPFLINKESLHFNFSHTKKAVLCCISKNNEVGTDIERIRTCPPLKIMEGNFHPKEIEYVNSFKNDKQAEAFFEIWTRKESYTKMNGTGICQDLSLINTLDNSNITTWKENSYICSVCSEDKSKLIKHTLTEDLIKNFFIK